MPPVFVTADGGVRIFVGTQPESMTAKQRRMLRRAARLERRAEKLRHKGGGANAPVIHVAPGATIDAAKLRALAAKFGGLDEDGLAELDELEGLDEQIALEVEDELREVQAELENDD